MLVVLEGNLGSDPNFIIKGDMKRLELFLLENRTKRNEETGETETLGTLPHNLVLFGKRAELFKDQLKKGMPVLVSGEQQATSYEKDGNDETSVNIIVKSIGVVPFPSNKAKNDDPAF